MPTRTARLVARLAPADPVRRRLAAITLVNTFGNGLIFTLSALYFTRIVGLSVLQVGVGLTIAGGLGVLAGAPLGHAADRFGIRPMLITLILLEAVGTAGYTLINSFAGFLAIVCFTTVADRGSNAVRGALYAVALPADQRTQARAYLRAVTNVGIGAGAATAAVALQADSRAAYVALILVDVVTFVASAIMLLRVPVEQAFVERRDADGNRRRNPALADRPYLVVIALNTVLALQFGMIEVGVPLWIVGHTHAPRAMVSVTLLANTVLVVLLQVRASRGISTVPAAARAARRGGILLAACCLLFAGSHGVPGWAAALVLLAAITVQSLAEVLCSVAGWALSYDLGDPAAPGAYQGVYASGFALSAMLAPIVVTSTALHFGIAGWAVLAGVFAAAGLALVPVCRWAASRREHAPLATPAAVVG